MIVSHATTAPSARADEGRAMAARSIPCWIFRGGTSRGVFLLARDLPPRGPLLDRVIESIMGESGPIDGLGGESILTSKVAIVGAPTRRDADVDDTFVQVGRSPQTLSYEGSCGNISAAVGPFALDVGLVAPREGVQRLRIHSVNIGKIIGAELEVRCGVSRAAGCDRADGVHGSSARVVLDFAQTVGSVTGSLAPLGAPLTSLDYGGPRPIDASVVDVANPVAFVRASDLGLRGNETPAEIEANRELLGTLEAIRGATAVRLGLAPTAADVARMSPYVPFVCYVAPPMEASVNSSSSPLRADVTARLVGYGQTHRSFPGTAAAALAAAARTRGSVVASVMSVAARTSDRLSIEHPSGTLEVDVRLSKEGRFERLAIDRTWRKILEGRVYLGAGVWP